LGKKGKKLGDRKGKRRKEGRRGQETGDRE